MPIANAKFKTMVSPITGQTQIYTLVNYLTAITPDSQIDPVAARNYLNQQYITENIDAVCGEVKHFQTAIINYVQVDNWIPAASPFPVAAILILVLFAVIKALPALLVIGAAVAAAWALKEFVINPLLYPRIFRGYDGSGPYTREEAVTYNAAYNPGKYVSPITTLVFDTPEDLAASDATVPPGWGLPQIQNIIGPIIGLLVIAGIVIVGIQVAPALIGGISQAFKPKPKKEG